MSKTVYLYDENTGELTGEYSSQKSPLEDDTYITPIHSTDKTPLTLKDGFAICYINGEWVYVEDIRGYWYTPSGEMIEISKLDEQVGVTWSRKTPPPTPEQIQAQANAEARAYLASTDWYVIRLTETGVAIPTEILAARQQARDSVTTSL